MVVATNRAAQDGASPTMVRLEGNLAVSFGIDNYLFLIGLAGKYVQSVLAMQHPHKERSIQYDALLLCLSLYILVRLLTEDGSVCPDDVAAQGDLPGTGEFRGKIASSGGHF